jgi:hypothetical protein
MMVEMDAKLANLDNLMIEAKGIREKDLTIA